MAQPLAFAEALAAEQPVDAAQAVAMADRLPVRKRQILPVDAESGAAITALPVDAALPAAAAPVVPGVPALPVQCALPATAPVQGAVAAQGVAATHARESRPQPSPTMASMAAGEAAADTCSAPEAPALDAAAAGPAGAAVAAGTSSVATQVDAVPLQGWAGGPAQGLVVAASQVAVQLMQPTPPAPPEPQDGIAMGQGGRPDDRLAAGWAAASRATGPATPGGTQRLPGVAADALTWVADASGRASAAGLPASAMTPAQLQQCDADAAAADATAVALPAGLAAAPSITMGTAAGVPPPGAARGPLGAADSVTDAGAGFGADTARWISQHPAPVDGGRLHLQLQSPETGRLDLDLRIDATGQAQLLVNADNPASGQALAERAGQLVDAMRDLGLQMQVDVRHGGGQGGVPGHAADGHARGRHAPGGDTGQGQSQRRRPVAAGDTVAPAAPRSAPVDGRALHLYA